MTTNKHGFYQVQKNKIVPVGILDLKENEIIPPEHIKDIKLQNDVEAHILKPNIIDYDLMSTKKLPVYFLQFLLDKKINTIPLAQLCVFFTIASNPSSQEELINTPLKGVFSLELFINKKRIVMDKNVSIETDKVELLVNVAQSDEMKSIVNSLVLDYVKIQQEQYGNPYDYEIPKNVKSLKDFCEDD